MQHPMKRFFTAVLLFLSATLYAQVQRVAYVDSEYILENLPQYRSAQAQLDKLARDYQREIDAAFAEIETMKSDLNSERILLTDDLIAERQDEIDQKIKAAKDLQRSHFGPEGNFIAQRRNLVKPIQDQIFNAVQEIAVKRRYDFVFDKSSDLIMLYSNKKLDISDQVLKKIKQL